MSIAFSSSLLGLAGSLILGFADLNLGQAQNKFLQFLEKTLQNNSSPDFINTSSSDPSALVSIQKIYDNLDSLVFVLKESSQNQSQIFNYMKSLTEQMKELKNNSREQDKKISNFLSTQLNTQTSMLQLTNRLNEEGIIDSQTKKYLENIDKSIQKLLSESK
jgi:seryl-tRNA synthetase